MSKDKVREALERLQRADARLRKFAEARDYSDALANIGEDMGGALASLHAALSAATEGDAPPPAGRSTIPVSYAEQARREGFIQGKAAGMRHAAEQISSDKHGVHAAARRDFAQRLRDEASEYVVRENEALERRLSTPPPAPKPDATEGEREEDRHEVSVTRQGVTIKVLAGDFDFAVDLSKRIDSFLVMPATPPLAPKKTDMDRCVACGHEREHHVPACRIGSPDDCHCAMFQEPTPKGPKPSGEWYCMQGRHANPQNCGPGACLGWAWRTLTPKDTPPPPDAARVESDVDGYCDPPAGPAPTREEARSKELLAALRDEKMKHAQVADYWAKQFAARDAEIATLRAQVEEAERSIEFLAATAENRARDIDHEKSRADAAEAKAKVAVRERDEALDALRDACEDRTDAERRIAEAVEFVAERVRETERQTERPTTWDALTYWETRQREAEMILRQLSDLTPQAGTEKK